MDEVRELQTRLSLPAWGEWIEIPRICRRGRLVWVSLPAWGEWIEIEHQGDNRQLWQVSPRMGRVD